jgi:hypothetical protein
MSPSGQLEAFLAPAERGRSTPRKLPIAGGPAGELGQGACIGKLCLHGRRRHDQQPPDPSGMMSIVAATM